MALPCDQGLHRAGTAIQAVAGMPGASSGGSKAAAAPSIIAPSFANPTSESPAMAEVTIYHNPACGTSRNTLALIRHAGIEPKVIQYLQTPPTQQELLRLLAAMGMTVREVLREKGTPYAELDLGNPKWTDDELLDFIARYPVLMNRPIVVSPLGARLCRPSEAVLELLPVDKLPPFTKEDGEVVIDSGDRRG
jgi:arsenate reductase